MDVINTVRTNPAHAVRPATSAQILVAALLGFFMLSLDATAVNVALPGIARTLGGSTAGLQWVVDAYTLMFAALLISAGAVSDRVGAKRLYAAGLAAFMVASAACGVAPALGFLIGGRAVQGSAAAITLPASLALVRQAFTDPARRLKAIALWSVGGAVAIAAGPTMTALLSSANLTSAKIAGRFGPRVTIWVGLLVSALGMLALLIASTGQDRLLLAAALVPAGLGLGFALPSLTVVLLDAIPADQAGLAAGMLNSSRQVGGTLAVAVFGAMISHRDAFIGGMRASMLIGTIVLLASMAGALSLRGRERLPGHEPGPFGPNKTRTGTGKHGNRLPIAGLRGKRVDPIWELSHRWNITGP